MRPRVCRSPLRVLGSSLVAIAVVTSTAAAQPRAALDTATFAGGCFWSMEHPFDTLPGVTQVTLGYTGGTVRAPTYRQVSSGATGHAEAVRVVFDPRRVPYERLLEVFWRQIDPFAAWAQFCDRGPQYRSGLFVRGAVQRAAALASRDALAREGRWRGLVLRERGIIRTEIGEAGTFWPAEVEHQHYYREHPLRYRLYRAGCGRDDRLRAVWGDARDVAVTR